MAERGFWSTPAPALILAGFAVVLFWALFYSGRTSLAPLTDPSIVLLNPSTEAEPPIRFRWIAPGYQRFRLVLREDSGAIVWEIETRVSDVTAPGDIVEQLKPGVRYFWKVEQLAANSSPVGESSVRPLTMRP
ncbi:MAG: hypothetical protein ACR2L2_16970 [Acidobacteriota bacterium]